jgi:hypothetical protein
VPGERDIADEPDFEAILTVEQFRARKSGRFGVIVIEDYAYPQPVFHDRHCFYVDEDSFKEKVLDNVGRNGRYWWAKNSKIAEQQLNARACGHPGDPFSKR